MQLVTLTEAIPSEGYAEGQTISVDEMSAAALIAGNRATAYEAPDADGDDEVVETIDDLVDPGVAAKRSQFAATIVGGMDPGPRPVAAKADEVPADGKADDKVETVEVTAGAKATTPPTTGTASSASAAPGPNPAGAVAGGNPRG